MLPRFPDALFTKWLHRGRVYPEDCFVCANRCCVISRWPAQCVVSYWLPMSFLIQGNVGVWPDLYSTWHGKGRFQTRRPCELSETAYDASERKLKKCCNPPTPLCPNTLTPTYTHLWWWKTNTHTQLRAWLYEVLIPPKCPPCCHLWSPKFEIVRGSLAVAVPVYH